MKEDGNVTTNEMVTLEMTDAFAAGKVPKIDNSDKQIKFSRKECAVFIAEDGSKNERCRCGRTPKGHGPFFIRGIGEEWSSDTHTKEYPTNAFGLVSFSQNQQESEDGSLFLRLADNTNVDSIWNLMRNEWSLKTPNLILSIYGENSGKAMDLDVMHSLEADLEEVIRKVDIWLLTSATSEEATKLAGSVFHHNFSRDRPDRNACIGIAPWGSIVEREQLITNGGDVIYTPRGEKTKVLDENHTHFLLVDNGTVNQYETERVLRAKLEKLLTNPGQSLSIPSVILLVGGGYTTCMQLRKNFHEHPIIPTVVLKGSGGLAEVIVGAFEATKERDRKGLGLLPQFASSLGKLFPNLDGEKKAKMTGTVREIVEKHQSKVFFFDPKRDSYGLSHVITEACQSRSLTKHSAFERFELAIRLGEAKSALLNVQEEFGKDADFLDKSLYDSLTIENEIVVTELLNYGVNLEKFVQREKNYIQELYKTVKSQQQDSKFYLQELLEDYVDEEFEMASIDRLLFDLMDGDYTFFYSKEQNGVVVNMTPSQQLMIWAALSKMYGIVKCFWTFEKDKALENGLILFRIFKALSKKDSFNEIDREELKDLAMSYQTLTVDLLTYCYKEDSEQAVNIVKSWIPLWGYKSMVTLAANGSSRDFVAHPCCQSYLKSVWHGKMDKKTVRSPLDIFKAKVRRRRRQIPEGNSREETSLAPTPRDKTDGGRLPRHRRAARAIAAFFRLLFFVPKGKLFVHAFMFTLFLAGFSYEVLVKKGEHHGWVKFVVFTIVTSLAIDELREIAEIRKRNVSQKLRKWFKSIWNKLDLLAITLFYIGFVFGFFDFDVAERTIMALDLVLWVVKFAQFYRIFYTLGPYLIMINKMMVHMVGFILVLVIAVFAYGIFMHTLLFPEVDISWQILFQLLFRPYLLVFGELGINSYTLSSNSTVYGTKTVSKTTEIVVVIGMCVYLLLANVLLLNMLIAVFNNIYEVVKENSDKIWKFDNYYLIMEFRKKPTLPIPLSIISNIPRILTTLCMDETRGSYRPEQPDKISEMKKLQNRCARGFLRERKQMLSTEESLALLLQRTSSLSKSVKKVDERTVKSFDFIKKLLKKVAK